MTSFSMKHALTALAAAVLLWGCSANSISEQDAREIAMRSAGIEENSVSAMSVETGTLDGTEAYIIQFETADRSYQTILSRTDGEMLRSSYQSKGPASDAGEGTQGNDPGESSDPSVISLEEAKSIALKDAGVSAADATFTKAKNDGSASYPLYEIEFHSASTYYEYEIGADGTIYQLEQESSVHQSGSGNEISLARAKQLALAKVEGATESDIFIEEEWDDGMHLYEGEIYHDNVKYEFEIAAGSGSFLKWSMDYRD